MVLSHVRTNPNSSFFNFQSVEFLISEWNENKAVVAQLFGFGYTKSFFAIINNLE